MKAPNQKRIIRAVLTGAILGVLCIIGVGTRVGFVGNVIYLIGMWYNRVIMGMIIGLAGDIVIIENNPKQNINIRGAILGLIVTSAIFLSTSFRDIPSFLVGVVYGIIIDRVASSISE